MPLRTLVSALRDVFAAPEDVHALAAEVPAVPEPRDEPPAWRRWSQLEGPYPRFALRFPRDWAVVSPTPDPLHLLPPDEDLDVALTVTTAPVGVAGPTGVLDAFEALAGARGVPMQRSAVRLDRWGEDGWAGSWAWRERQDGGIRSWWMLLVGHDQHLVYAMLNGQEDHVAAVLEEAAGIFATLRLPPADRLAPEHFPTELCSELNARRLAGEPPWSLDPEGNLMSGPLVVRLFDLYRAYLRDGDLARLAGALDLRARTDLDSTWAGQPWESVADDVRVVLRRGEAMEALDVVAVPLGGDLVACPVLDTDDRMTFVPSDECERWGLLPGELVEQGVRRLERASSLELEEILDEGSGDLLGFRLADGDGYDSGRLLSPRLREHLERMLGGPMVVAMPAASLVLVVREDAAERLSLADTTSLSFRRRPRPLSDRLWRWTEAGLVPS